MGIIKINDRFSIERDSDGWTLYEAKTGINPKTKELTASVRRRYYPTLHTIINHMIDLAPSEASTLRELVWEIDQIRGSIFSALRHVPKANENKPNSAVG